LYGNRSAGQGSADGVVSSFAGSFEAAAAVAFKDFARSYFTQQLRELAASINASNGTAYGNYSGVAGSGGSLSADAAERLARLEKQVPILEALAIAGICMGVAGLVVAMFGSCRIFVRSSLLFGHSPGWTSIHPTSGGPGSSSSRIGDSNGVRRQKSVGNMSDSSLVADGL
jgi:hypothetical protein